MKIAGTKLICDNCGHEVFLEKQADRETDGGYTHIEVYEDAPQGWRLESVLGKYVELCPECTNKFESVIICEMPKIAEIAGVSMAKAAWTK